MSLLLKGGHLSFQPLRVKHADSIFRWTEMIANAKPTYEEFQNTGAGSNTSQRKYLTKATAAVKIESLLGGDYKSWVNAAF